MRASPSRIVSAGWELVVHPKSPWDGEKAANWSSYYANMGLAVTKLSIDWPTFNNHLRQLPTEGLSLLTCAILHGGTRIIAVVHSFGIWMTQRGMNPEISARTEVVPKKYLDVQHSKRH